MNFINYYYYFIAITTTSGTGTNPRKISVEEMKKLFEATYYGTEVNF